MFKRILFIIGISFASLRACGQQSASDTTMATYLKTHRYILLSDSTHLPQSIQPYYTAIMAFTNGDYAYLKNCYIPAGGTLDEQYTLTITLMDIAGIRVLKNYEKTGTKTAEGYNGLMKILMVEKKPMPKGNLSGRDGKLIINKLINRVEFKQDK